MIPNPPTRPELEKAITDRFSHNAAKWVDGFSCFEIHDDEENWPIANQEARYLLRTMAAEAVKALEPLIEEACQARATVALKAYISSERRRIARSPFENAIIDAIEHGDIPMIVTAIRDGQITPNRLRLLSQGHA